MKSNDKKNIKNKVSVEKEKNYQQHKKHNKCVSTFVVNNSFVEVWISDVEMDQESEWIPQTHLNPK